MNRVTLNVFLSQNINLTVKSCENKKLTNLKQKNKKSTTSSQLNLKLDTFYDLTNENWLPIYTDNINWNHIEFVCEIELKLSLINDHLNLSNEYKYVIEHFSLKSK